MRAGGHLATSASAWRTLFLLTSLLLFTCNPVHAKDDPIITPTRFDNPPVYLHYFRHSNVILLQESLAHTIWRSQDAGATWKKADTIEHDKAFALVMHEYDPNRAYVLTRGNVHWKTKDKGETWETFFTDAYTSDRREFGWMVFHADDPDRIIFYGMDCESIFCKEVVMYTTDGFENDAKFLRSNAIGCWWAKSSDLFTTGEDDLDANRVLCIIHDPGLFTRREDNRLVISDNYFSAKSGDSTGAIQEFEPDLDNGHTVRGAINIASVKKYLLVATTSKNTDEMALYVTGDTTHWHRAIFPQDHRLDQEAYTVLESTNYSIQIDVMASAHLSEPMGVLLTSNSNGTYFTRNVEHTNRDPRGIVDFEKVSGIQGIFLVNQVDNWEEVEQSGHAKKKVKTRITFDDGRTFEPVKSGDDEIHLHSVTELDNIGPVFSSPAPGLVMGNGNRGSHLKSYNDSNLYVSDDAGRTWIEGPKGPHKYEFGDQGSILFAVKESNSEEADIDELRYSLDHGKEWKTVKLPDNLRISPWILTTEQGSTSLKFVLAARTGPKSNPSGFYVISVDFDGLHEATCKDGDMEDWFARTDGDGNPSCIMGQTQKYRRRKKTAECFIKQEFKDLVPQFSPCDCTDADFECDFNFRRDGDDCKLAGPVPAPEGACKSNDPDETFKGSSGWRLIPGNRCKRTDGSQKDDEKEWKCSDSTAPPTTPGNGKVHHISTPFKGEFPLFEKHYLERGEVSTRDDETVIARPISSDPRSFGDIFITHDHGKNWDTPDYLRDKNIWAIVTHPYVKDMAFFLTTEEKVFYTADRGRHFESFKVKGKPDTTSNRLPLAFHPDRKGWLIWHGKNCEGDDGCHVEATLSTDRGFSWKMIRRYVERCEFTGSSAYGAFRNETQIICLASKREDNDDNNPKQLLYSDDFRSYDLTAVQDNVKDFATMAEFIVVATENQTENTLNALASINGRDYAHARFPFNFEVPHQRAYTVLDSSTHAVNLFVVTEDSKDHRYGSILKSNSNGTSYVLSASGVNCDNAYYVDFERMLGLEGVILVNVVVNPDSDSEPKRLQTKISHNDGAQWAFLPPPETDVDRKEYGCRSKHGDEYCALHIHGYTERIDHGKTYSSESAVGLMFGIGNVGPVLGEVKDADTFMTTDAGLTWRNVKKGRWTWSFGDQGSIIVLAPTDRRTKLVSYSTDEGNTWIDYLFSDTEVTISDITTLRSGSSRNFLLWGHSGDHLLTINLDFTGLTDRPCRDKGGGDTPDYYLWSPEHPLQPDGCLFGHKNQYLRKKKDSKCYNDQPLRQLVNVVDCECTRQDFECDYNFELGNHNQCKLVEGLKPMSAEQYCAEHPDEVTFYEPSGFRRIPLTTCKGGNEMDKVLTAHPCPGHEEEFERARRASGVAIFFAVIIPVALASLAGWWVWRNWQGKFGQIRLGEQSSLDNGAPWVKYPVVAVSAVVALVGTLPLLAGSLWRSISLVFDRFRGGGSGRGEYSWLHGGRQRRFTTRDSFARGRGDYAVVDEDEGELLGDDSDDEV
ncbi:hypothetical protein DL762_010213 [Monosporascus cannonballus]|uniref:Vacuolar protein sorting/targeting protein 10 n=1 Tax=Monosporascus cannonballus TaxID=155416 RepID=A0ABY0GUH4_9PEZI|nr:hypothetical protein DL762_010213 [Monosporascus cannonballus]